MCCVTRGRERGKGGEGEGEGEGRGEEGRGGEGRGGEGRGGEGRGGEGNPLSHFGDIFKNISAARYYMTSLNDCGNVNGENTLCWR